jgi:hypothetical protein
MLTTYLATTGVKANVIGVLTGNKALLQINANARVELPPLMILSSQLSAEPPDSSIGLEERRPTRANAPFTSNF